MNDLKKALPFTHSCEGKTLRVTITGEIDHHSAKTIRDGIDELIFDYRPASLYLNFSHVEFMDSSGLGLILGRFNKASEMGTEFTLLNPADSVRKILDVAGIARMIKIERKK